MMECSLCGSTYKKPKCLPCLHSFCLECLEEYVDKNDSPDELPCPRCREMFTIPAEGMSGLRDSFFLLPESSVLFETKSSMNNSSDIRCGVCQERNDASSSPVAQIYCKDCTQYMCITCADTHGKLKGTRLHVTVLLSDIIGSEVSSTFNIPISCDKHKTDLLRLYCIACKVPVCILCCAVDHHGHQCEEIEDAATKFRGQFQRQISELGQCFVVFSAVIHKLKTVEYNVRKQSEENESNIREKCNEIRRALDLFEVELLDESKTHPNDILKELTSRMSEAECLHKELKNVKEDLEKMNGIRSHSDVACSGKQLLERAERLLEESRESFSKQTPAGKHIQFFPYLGVVFGKSRIGQICVGEGILLTLGLQTTDSSVKQKICEISLVKPDTVNVINSTPAKIDAGSAACVVSNVLYAVGLGGAARNQLWAWSASRDDSFNDKKKQPWTRCADMSSGRRGHCVTSVGNKIYVLGGWKYAGEKTLDTVLCYDIHSNKWSEAGKLCHAVMSATCVTYSHCIYVFSGGDSDTGVVNHVQIYDTTTRNVALSSNPIPAGYYLMKAVLWKTTALLIGRDTCYIYDFESDTWQERKRFKTDVVQFGLTIDNNTLYITGGGTHTNGRWTCRADVKSLLVDGFISDNEEAEWKHHATLPTPANIHAYSPVSMII